MKKDLLSIADLTQAEILELFTLARTLKADLARGLRHPELEGQTLAMIFEKPSLRTRVTLEAAMTQLGGHAISLQPGDIQMGEREPVADVARNLSLWVDGIAARTFAHQTVEELAHHAQVPVINALSDTEHPLQALADFFTLFERGRLDQDLRLAFIGDGNNVCHSLMLAAVRLGVHFRWAGPPGYEPSPQYVEQAQREAATNGASVLLTHDPRTAAQDAGVLYTDVWASMGQEAERAVRLPRFQGYRVDEQLVALARPEAVVMHCLPAHRGEEIVAAVLDGPQSIVLEEAENRLHIQKALLVNLLARRSG